ncbi:MAG TPA: DUF1269 domain-containing protein [Chloroflexota bacterium]
MGSQIIVATFGGTGTAEQVLHKLRGLEREGWVRTLDAAILVRGQDGQPSIRDTEDVDAPHGALAGAVTGALVGLLAGPAGAAAGALAGAAGGGVGASMMHFGFDRDDLQAIVAELQPGTSAIVAAVEPTVGDKLVSELEELHGKIVHRVLRDVATAQMRATLDGWQAHADAEIQKLNSQIADQQTKLAAATATTQAAVQQRLATLRAQRDET